MAILDGKSVLITGGTGSFGSGFVGYALHETAATRIVIFSRDEQKQWEMRQRFANDARLRFFLGDVRDAKRLHRAFAGIDMVVHAAALKQVPAAEYNPFEAVKTNIHGSQNVIDAAIDQGVKRVLALSTDKASNPVSLYGATKLVSDRLFVDGNAYAGGRPTRFAVVRFGNLAGSRGSVVPLFQRLAPTGTIPITDEGMTRFWISIREAVQFSLGCMERMTGGEIFVPKIPSVRLTDLAQAIAPDAKRKIVGARPGEKIHEELIGPDDAQRTRETDDCYVILPSVSRAQQYADRAVPDDFHYTSDHNDAWLDLEAIRESYEGLCEEGAQTAMALAK